MKKLHVFLAVLVLLTAGVVMIERNSPIESDTYHFQRPSTVEVTGSPAAIEAYPVDDWYAVEPTEVFPYEAYPVPAYEGYPAPEYGGYPVPEYSGYPAPYWGVPTPAPEPGEYPYPAP